MYKNYEISTEFRKCHSITQEINDFVKEAKIKEGILTVVGHHATIGFAVTSFWDPRGLDDLLDELDRSFPTRVMYERQVAPYDSSGHVKSSLLRNSLNLMVSNGEVVLGSSQGVVLLDFDGPNTRNYSLHLNSYNDLSLSSIEIETSFMSMNDITTEVESIIKDREIDNGFTHISVLHSTAGLVVMNNQEKSTRDFSSQIELLIPTRVDFKHRETAADAGGHIKTAYTGTQLTIPVVDGELKIDKDQSIFFAEFDGPRPRKIFVGLTKGKETYNG